MILTLIKPLILLFVKCLKMLFANDNYHFPENILNKINDYSFYFKICIIVFQISENVICQSTMFKNRLKNAFSK